MGSAELVSRMVGGLMLLVAGYAAVRLVLSTLRQGSSDRWGDASHLAMGLGMAAMLTPGVLPASVSRLPWTWFWCTWLAFLLAASLRRGRGGAMPARVGHRHHAVAAAAMALMWLAPGTSAGPAGGTAAGLHGMAEMAGMAGMPGMPGMDGIAGMAATGPAPAGRLGTSLLALALFGYLVYSAAALTAGAAADAAGCRSRDADGPAGRSRLRAAGPVARLMAPGWTYGCEVMMSLAMAGMLYLLV